MANRVLLIAKKAPEHFTDELIYLRMLTDFILTEGNFEAIEVLLNVQTGLNLLDKTLNTLLLFHLWSYFRPLSGLLRLVTPMSSTSA